MAWKWLWYPWLSVGITVGMVALSVLVYLLAGVVFVFFVLPIPIIWWGVRDKTV